MSVGQCPLTSGPNSESRRFRCDSLDLPIQRVSWWVAQKASRHGHNPSYPFICELTDSLGAINAGSLTWFRSGLIWPQNPRGTRQVELTGSRRRNSSPKDSQHIARFEPVDRQSHGLHRPVGIGLVPHGIAAHELDRRQQWTESFQNSPTSGKRTGEPWRFQSSSSDLTRSGTARKTLLVGTSYWILDQERPVSLKLQAALT